MWKLCHSTNFVLADMKEEFFRVKKAVAHVDTS